MTYPLHRKFGNKVGSTLRVRNESRRQLVVEQFESRRLLAGIEVAPIVRTGLIEGVSWADTSNWEHASNREQAGSGEQLEVATVLQAADHADLPLNDAPPPTGLRSDPQAGSSLFHRVFVTGNSYAVASGAFSGPTARQFADMECTLAAFDAGWIPDWDGGTLVYTAFLSHRNDPIQNARDRLNLQGPIINTLFQTVWSNPATYLSTPPLAPWAVSEYGGGLSEDTVWTGSNFGGYLAGDCNGWTDRFTAGDHGSVFLGVMGGVEQGCQGSGQFLCFGPAEVGTISTSVLDGFVYHQGSVFDSGDISLALDTGKSMAKEGKTPQILNFDNLINSSRGINGLVFDFHNLPGFLSNGDFVFQWSPQGAFNEFDHLPQTWLLAPQPIEITTLAGTTDRVILHWQDNAIANRWLRVTILANGNTGLQQPEVYYIGHLLGETTGPTDGAYTVSFADIPPIRTAVGQSAAVSSIVDIDKNGTVSFADISAMRPNVGAQLTNITIPAPAPSGAPMFGSGDSKGERRVNDGLSPGKLDISSRTMVLPPEAVRLDTTIRISHRVADSRVDTGWRDIGSLLANRERTTGTRHAQLTSDISAVDRIYGSMADEFKLSQMQANRVSQLEEHFDSLDGAQ